MSLKPLPCPFCGSTNFDVRDGSTFRWRSPYCVDCEATASEVRIQTLGEGTKEEWEAQARTKAIEEWNRRAIPGGYVLVLESALTSLRLSHHYCEDSWYSCPKHEDGCANKGEGNTCNCGADEHNAKIDAALAAAKEK